MQIHRPLKHHIEKYRLAAQDLRLWVLDVLAWWVGLFGDRGSRLYMQRCVRDARSETRQLIFLAVIARMNVQHGRFGVMRPPPSRRGFRSAHRRFRPIHIFTRGIALKTLDDIRRTLESFDAVIDRALARLPKHGVNGKLIAVAPPMLAHAQTIFRPEPCAADTS